MAIPGNAASTLGKRYPFVGNKAIPMHWIFIRSFPSTIAFSCILNLFIDSFKHHNENARFPP